MCVWKYCIWQNIHWYLLLHVLLARLLWRKCSSNVHHNHEAFCLIQVLLFIGVTLMFNFSYHSVYFTCPLFVHCVYAWWMSQQTFLYFLSPLPLTASFHSISPPDHTTTSIKKKKKTYAIAFQGRCLEGNWKWMGILYCNSYNFPAKDNFLDGCQNWIAIWPEHLFLV